MKTFALDITVTPRKSQAPGAASYAAKAIWTQKPVDIVTFGESQGVHSSVTSTMGVRLSDYPIPPKEGDLIDFQGQTYLLADVDPDGQGGATWTLKNRRGEF